MSPDAADQGTLLAFLRPGVLHELGNALFVIRGQVEVGDGGEGVRERISGACARAEAALAVLRDLGGGAGERDPVALDELVGRLVGVARVPLRERGVRLEQAPATAAAAPVDGAIVLPALAAALQALVARLPAGFEGELRLEVGEDDGRPLVAFTLAAAPGRLPFPLDLRAAADAAAAIAGGCGVQARCEPGLTVRF